jgi:polar amino acid transport system substrate-binding protein
LQQASNGSAGSSARNPIEGRHEMHVRSKLAAAAAVAAAALSTAVIATAAVAPPPNIANAGRIVFCSDLGYPPMESLQGARPIGADIDIGRAVASLMDVKAEFRNVGFDGIIAALLAKKCDAILSGMTDTAERRKQVDFTDYLIVGMSLMVKKGNPHHITGLASLSGRRVAVQVGTTEKDALTALNKRLSKQHRKPVVIKLFNKDSDAAAALVTGKVDAYFSDDPPVGYYVRQSGGKFEVAANRIQAAPYGIATRKRDPLGAATRRAIAQLYANGTMKAILAKWGLSAFALKR